MHACMLCLALAKRHILNLVGALGFHGDKFWKNRRNCAVLKDK